jgi:TetR/AcrR family transcriptional regulator, mexJK operon transcriptional repressor
MRTRDVAEYQKKREQIMEAALAVFAEKGYAKATNLDIAQAAGLGTPALIYHYFKGKADLLRQAVEARSPVEQILGDEEALMALAPRDALTRIGSLLYDMLSDAASVTLFRVMLSEALRQPSVADAWAHSISSRRFRVLSRYLAVQMDRGVLRRMDQGAAVRCFIGPLFLYMMTHTILPVNDTQALAPETMVQAAVDVFLQGMERRPENRESD